MHLESTVLHSDSFSWHFCLSSSKVVKFTLLTFSVVLSAWSTLKGRRWHVFDMHSTSNGPQFKVQVSPTFRGKPSYCHCCVYKKPVTGIWRHPGSGTINTAQKPSPISVGIRFFTVPLSHPFSMHARESLPVGTSAGPIPDWRSVLVFPGFSANPPKQKVQSEPTSQSDFCPDWVGQKDCARTQAPFQAGRVGARPGDSCNEAEVSNFCVHFSENFQIHLLHYCTAIQGHGSFEISCCKYLNLKSIVRAWGGFSEPLFSIIFCVGIVWVFMSTNASRPSLCGKQDDSSCAGAPASAPDILSQFFFRILCCILSYVCPDF